MPVIELLPEIYVPTFEMLVDSTPLPPIARSVLEVSVTEVANQASSFSFRLNDPTLKFIDRDVGLFNEGKRVEISLGYLGIKKTTKKMIEGKITALTADFPSGGPATLEVQGFDLLHTATRGTAFRQFEEGKLDSDIVSEIAQSDMRLKPSVDATKPRAGRRVQNNVTNLKFLEGLATANGYFLWVNEDTLYFKMSRPGDPIQLEWGKTLMSFSPRLSTAGQVSAIEVRGWDPVQKQSISARAQLSGSAAAALAATGQQQIGQGAGGRSERVIVCEASVSSAQEAQTFAEGALADQQRTLIGGSGASVGHPDIRVGTVLDLSKIGRLFSRKYVVERVTHTYGVSGYQTSFEVRVQ